jgi:hypothetical protein
MLASGGIQIPRKELRCPLDRRLFRHQNWSGRCGEEKDLELNPNSSVLESFAYSLY